MTKAKGSVMHPMVVNKKVVFLMWLTKNLLLALILYSYLDNQYICIMYLTNYILIFDQQTVIKPLITCTHRFRRALIMRLIPM